MTLILILLPYADTWVPRILGKGRRYGIDPIICRTERFKQTEFQVLLELGKFNHKDRNPNSRRLMHSDQGLYQHPEILKVNWSL
jgi:hypothetical protein